MIVNSQKPAKGLAEKTDPAANPNPKSNQGSERRSCDGTGRRHAGYCLHLCRRRRQDPVRSPPHSDRRSPRPPTHSAWRGVGVAAPLFSLIPRNAGRKIRADDWFGGIFFLFRHARYIDVGQTKISFLLKAPLYLVVVSSQGEPEAVVSSSLSLVASKPFFETKRSPCGDF